MKNSNLILIIIFTAMVNFLTMAQFDVTHQEAIGGDGQTGVSDMINAPDGGFYVAGTSTSSSFSGNLEVESFGPAFCWLIKYNDDFTVAWQKSYGGDNEDGNPQLKITDDGLFLFSTSSSNVSGNKTVDSYGVSDGWLLKLDFDGEIIWQKSYGGVDRDNVVDIIELPNKKILLFFRSISIDSDVGIRTAPLKGTRDYWVVKIDSDGEVIWDKSYGSNGENGMGGVTVLDNGNIIISGTCIGCDASIDKTEDNYGSADLWLVCIDEDGVLQWEKTIGGGNTEIRTYIFSDGEYSYICCPSSSGISGLRTVELKGYFDIWVIKIDANGEIIWDKSYGGALSEAPYTISEIKKNRFLISALSNSDISYDKNEDSRGGSDFWSFVIDENGELLEQKTLGGAKSDTPSNILVRENKVIIGGVSYSDVSGDKTVPKWNDDENYFDAWLIELDKETLGVSSINNADTSIDFNVYPNPVTSNLTVEVSTNDTYAKTIEIKDLQGRLVYNHFFNSKKENIDLSSLESGVYTVTLIVDNFLSTVKIVKR